MLADDVELGMVGAVRDADGGGSVTGAGIGITGGGGGGAVIATAWEAPLAIILFMSIGSDFIMGGCDMTTGWGGGSAGVLIIGLIWVDPTFIVGAFAGDCCIVLNMAADFNIFAITEKIEIEIIL